MERVRAHLHAEGLFAFETRNPRWARQSRADQESPGERALRPEAGLFAFLESRTEEKEGKRYIDSSGREVRVSLTQVYDHVTQILHWTNYRRWREGEQEQTQVTRIAVRYTFPQELAALLYYNGFQIRRQYGDWELEPLTAASPSIIVVCRKWAY